MRQKVSFKSGDLELAGQLERPAGDVKFYALFAHCFTCGKDIAAATRISRALTQQGIAVLRFDFTGLGNSDGDFANSNFSSNIQDLVAAADHLRTHFDAPQLLIGHSLGGAAVLAAAEHIPEVSAITTIGAPSDAQHVAHNFEAHLDEINAAGEAKVSLAGREFTIKKQFVEDIAKYDRSHIGKLKRALLVMHSPVDATVNISEAEKIYASAKHPKSFISLDNADHLLSNKNDAEYAATLIANWANRYVKYEQSNYSAKLENGKVLVEEKDHIFTQHVSTKDHTWLADEPLKVGGSNLGPDPYDHILAGLGACTSMTLRMYATLKKLPLDHIKVELEHTRDYYKDCDNGECTQNLEAITRKITLRGDLTEVQRQRLLEIADKCPVHKTLHNSPFVVSELVE
ncbi:MULTISPECIES: bifunctional alpha/beta hydrolase/OsmC family protein [unclassified Pseudoalteromonas]|uniref:bifunctional alpha/beta hydrolase/OsmC family protein n=1 Tax=unclassified Pseudoalteromonas TaxID=194690 RepID=UPI000B747BC5|nr:MULTISPECIES: bifunctional alpha/beta hydrolase/OsmC family protein [unclassified Pseudoalteromonas]MAJ40017.1 osmotically inducible protein C [Pseudoalteromonadaceae bacterium]OUX88845.1 MAG: osmotically inducible protein C [Pseudoalteromonas sp. TMED43]MDC9565766.1 bifunctional alpha/beta hydrolase/OsmC family protein [Pseudoalteromonas sp. GAB2316C]MDC9570097.1 bifunctional alpha/beta hydrolase/OsmC family protein [Pseudoalteromonas sp. GABNB9D]MDC9574288.1 bifunctional alpha/beta hydrol